MALPQTVGLKAEAVDEEGVNCACTVEEVDDDYVIVSFDGWNAEWNRRVCDPREIRDRTLPDRKKKAKKPLRWLIYVFNSVVDTKLPALLSHRRSTTVSLETYPFIHYVNKKLKLRLSSISGVNLHNLSWTKSL